ncbi:NAD-dependent epimerase [Vallitalea guaymasensis]|uniref:NAD-dependent epimerase n=1 Tax=Vallitalea guaymasensis TaxID=1185412 RepID=UPI0019310A05|nr:NAD-dependent epimerase [Vallitalea guaymasensis]
MNKEKLKLPNEQILVTGCAGFIGFHLSKYLLKENIEVIGVDNINDYYDINLKYSRLDILKKYNNFKFYKVSLEDEKEINNIFVDNNIKYVVNLAAQAGVRYSLKNPKAYIDSNIVGFLSILEACKNHDIKHLVYASSSSVYGGNKQVPFSTNHNVDHPVSLYAATKKANELMAHTYSHLYNLPTTGLRFFTVYGPWGRPDMALFLFTDAILKDKPINVFNYGKMVRDFTYVDDIVEGIVKLINYIPKRNKEWNDKSSECSKSFAPYKVYNIGNNCPIELEYFISVLEDKLGKSAIKKYLPMQPGDVPKTYADVSDLEKDISFKPKTDIEDGITEFVDWYRDYYKR